MRRELIDSRNAVRIGVLGCGQIAQQHLTNYANIPGVQVVACADIDEVAGRTTAEKFGIPNICCSAKEMLERDDLDAVDVCLHNNLHVSGTLAVLESGRHVYCEKPMAGSYRDALTMLETARAAGKMLHIQLAFLYEDEARAAKELIDAGELGDIYHARSTGFRRRGRPFVDGYGKPSFVQQPVSGGGALYDMGVYHISELLYLLGNPTVERISGKTYQKLAMNAERSEAAGYSVEELGLGFVRFANELTLDIIEAWAIHMDNLEGSSILGSKGGIRLRPFSFHRAVGELDLSSKTDLGTARFRWNALHGEGVHYGSSQHHWVAALRGEVNLLPTAEIALNTMLISEGIYLSAQRGQEVSAEEVRSASVSKALPL